MAFPGSLRRECGEESASEGRWNCFSGLWSFLDHNSVSLAAFPLEYVGACVANSLGGTKPIMILEPVDAHMFIEKRWQHKGPFFCPFTELIFLI